MKPLSPPFKYFGSKNWKLYPAPNFPIIIEPFAGSAGYSRGYHDRAIILNDLDLQVVENWKFAQSATPEEIFSLPVDTLKLGEEIFEIPGISRGAAGIIKDWQRVGGNSCTKVSIWGSPYLRFQDAIKKGRDLEEWTKNGLWGENIKIRIACQQPKISHWKIFNKSYLELPNWEGTWFIDPPYQHISSGVYANGSDGIDFGQLAEFVKSRKGEVIVCEQEGADWLEGFEILCENRNTIRAKVKENKKREVIYYAKNS